MQKTKNYGLNKPEQREFYNVDDFNENAEILDETLSKFASEYALLADLLKHNVTKYRGETADEIGALYASSHTNAKDNDYYKAIISHNVSYDVLGGGTWYLEGVRVTSTYGFQKVTSYGVGTTVVYKRTMYNGVWKGWEKDATTADLAKVDGTIQLTTSILEKAVTLSAGVYNYSLYSYTATDLPHENYKYGMATVFVRSNLSIVVVLWGSDGATIDYRRIAVNSYNGKAWSGWEQGAFKSDLANYLPLTGGRIIGNGSHPFSIQGSQTPIYLDFLNITEQLVGALGFADVDIPVFIPKSYDKVYRLLHTGNVGSYALSKTGEATQDLKGTSTTPLGLDASKVYSSHDEVWQAFKVAGVTKGYLGFYNDVPSYRMPSSPLDLTYALLHEGNIGSHALPIGGGTVGTVGTSTPLYVKGASEYSLIGFKNADGTEIGRLGYKGANPVYYTAAEGAKTLHHDGNSNKIVFTASNTTAPADTTALWAHL